MKKLFFGLASLMIAGSPVVAGDVTIKGAFSGNERIIPALPSGDSWDSVIPAFRPDSGIYTGTDVMTGVDPAKPDEQVPIVDNVVAGEDKLDLPEDLIFKLKGNQTPSGSFFNPGGVLGKL